MTCHALLFKGTAAQPQPTPHIDSSTPTQGPHAISTGGEEQNEVWMVLSSSRPIPASLNTMSCQENRWGGGAGGARNAAMYSP